jgi:hypothetical protein
VATLALMLFVTTIANPWVWAYGCAPTPSPGVEGIERQVAPTQADSASAGCVIHEPRSSDIALRVLVLDALLPTPSEMPLEVAVATFSPPDASIISQRVDAPPERPPTFIAA